MVAFSGEVEFHEDDHNSLALLNQKFTEINMNPGLKGRDMRKAFDTDDYQVMLVATNSRPVLTSLSSAPCMWIKSWGRGVCADAVAPEPYLSGKAQSGTFVLDFYNEPDEILGLSSRTTRQRN
jgi:type I restriction enzyme R subunit